MFVIVGAMQTDRRMSRTRKLLRDAMYALTLSKGYDAITVQDLLDHSGVARSSFYAHFRGKDDLLLQGFREISPQLTDKLFDETPVAPQQFPDFAGAIFLGVDAYRGMARALLGESHSPALQHLRNLFVVQLREWLAQRTQADAQTIELAVQYVVGALLATLLWWLQNEFQRPVAQLAREFNAMTQQGIAALLAAP